jgi:hypothetical protein
MVLLSYQRRTSAGASHRVDENPAGGSRYEDLPPNSETARPETIEWMAEKTRATPRCEEEGPEIPEPENRQDCSEANPDPEENWHQQKAKLIDEILGRMEAQLKDGDFRVSVGDFIRLLEMRKVLEEERPREITVRWVEPSEMDDARA